jgi:hypothetical protein
VSIDALVPTAPLPSATTALAAPKPSASSAPPPRSVLPSAESSATELKLLEQAQNALVATPAAAIVLADEDARRFPDGVLRQEAEVIAIEALLRVGNRAGAESRAEKFRTAYPTSPHLRRMEAILGHP